MKYNLYYGITLAVISVLTFTDCNQVRNEQFDPAAFVNMKIGTKSSNTFVTAVYPFGMVSPGPFYNAAKGRALDETMTVGFSHIHASGVGCGDLWGAISLMPVSGDEPYINPGFSSPIKDEVAVPGYYSVNLSKYNIRTELTASKRAAYHRYTFLADKPGKLLVDLTRHLNPRFGDSQISVVSGNEVSGYMSEGAFCSSNPTRHKIYFWLKSSKPFKNAQLYSDFSPAGQDSVRGANLAALLAFDLSTGRVIDIKMGISYVSAENARENMEAEIGSKTFDEVKQASHKEWNRLLSRIRVEGGSDEDKTLFYTALYHCLLHPNIFSDVNGDFLSFSKYPAPGPRVVEKAKGYTHYSLFSLWDTYRNLHPLFCLVYPEYQVDMVKSVLDKYREKGWLPKWEHANVETYNMNGAPASVMLADTYMRGLRGYDTTLAFEAIYKEATFPDTSSRERNRPGLEQYIKYGGWIPQDFVMIKPPVWGPVSTTLEYNLADWSFAQMCRQMGHDSLSQVFYRRSLGYRNFFNPDFDFLMPKTKDGKWYSPFDPEKFLWFTPGTAYVEGTAWNYAFFVPHDMDGLKQLMGGDEAFTEHLRACFDNGYFQMSNEPDIAYPWLFNYADGQAWLTQKTVRELVRKYFKNSPNGLPGDDDAGTMSAWLVYAMMGFYPDCPASNIYQLASPVFDKVTLTLNRDYYPGKAFTITGHKTGPDDLFVRSMKLNGLDYREHTLNYKDIVSGGNLEMELYTR